jgi:Uma2 family endonuclease
MAGSTLGHAAIARNTARAIEDALGERPCWVYGSDAAVRLSPSEYRFPDVTITCAEGDRPTIARTEVHTPRICLEVLPESTRKADETDRADLYRACSSVQEFGFIGTRRQVVEVHRRTEAGWLVDLYGPNDVLAFRSIGVEVPVAALYRRTDVPLLAKRRRPQEAGVPEAPNDTSSATSGA